MTQLSTLAEDGGHFTKLLGNFLARIFGDSPPEETSIALQAQKSFKTFGIRCGLEIESNVLMVAGDRGKVGFLELPSILANSERDWGHASSERDWGHENINSIVRVTEDLIVCGTDTGLDLVNVYRTDGRDFRSRYRENITAVANIDGRIVSGSRNGHIRLWQCDPYQLTEMQDLKIGKQIQKIVAFGPDVLVAVDQDLVFLDDRVRVKGRISLDFNIVDFDVVDDREIVACGVGNVAQLDLKNDLCVRLTGASHSTNYSAVVALTHQHVCVGTEKGRLIAMDINSGGEVGALDLNFSVRGLINLGGRMLAYGAGRRSGDSAAFVTWKRRDVVPARSLA